VRRLRGIIAEGKRFDDMLGASEPMRRLYDLIERISDSDATVLIAGESGTGKELVARALHRRGRRAAGPFVAINCAAMLFLDEIGDLPLTMQPKLLRALETRKVRPVGGGAEAAFDVNLVTATNRDLEAAVAEGHFREDLFYRVNVVKLEVPPLRARAGDILLLAQHFLERFSARAGKRVVGLSSAVAKKLLAYPWPGNVRELQNCLERAVAVTRAEEIAVDDLPERVRDHRSANVLVVADDPTELVPLEVVERRYVLRVLEAAGGNKSVAARILGLDRKTLYRRLESYGVDRKP
jgi:two-component system response regulator HydG